MKRPHTQSLAAASGLLALAVLAAPRATSQATPAPAPTTCHDFTAVHDLANQLFAAVPQRGTLNTPAEGMALSIARDGSTLYEQTFGNYANTTVVPIASATKWLSGAVILSLVDDGLLDLDEPVSTYLPAFTGQKGTMTVRQMFSHTSGLPGSHPITSVSSITLEQAVQFIANRVNLAAPPGSQFEYGGVSMHVAGRVAEVVSGQSWEQLFQNRIAGPLGMTATDYQGLGSTTNPRIAGGAQSTLNDYRRFIEMVGGNGLFRGTRVLSEASIEIMLSDQTGGAPIVGIPSTAPQLGYGIGCWIESVDATGRPTTLSSPGAFGCTPWIDRERGTEGVLLIESQNQRVAPFATQLLAATEDVIRFRGTECLGTSTPSCNGVLRVRTNRIPRAGDTGFSIQCSGVPSLQPGTLIVGLPVSAPPIQLLGIDLFVPLDPSTIAVPVSNGVADVIELAVPLDGVTSGSAFSLQFVFRRGPGCALPGPFASSHALGVSL